MTYRILWPVQVGGFELEEIIGRGGTAVVYRARDAEGRAVALKVLHPELAQEDGPCARARREGEALARISSPHVVRIVAVGEDPHVGPWAATELSLAPRLSDVLGTSPDGLEPKRACELVAQVLDGVAALHEVGVLHRDIKPDNIFVERRDGRECAVLFDLSMGAMSGAAHLTPPGTVMGSPAYASPERVAGAAGDARSDVWAAGVLLYQCLSGESPFEGDDLRALLAAILRDAPTPLSAYVSALPDAITSVVRRALERDPDARYRDAPEMRRALLAAIAR